MLISSNVVNLGEDKVFHFNYYLESQKDPLKVSRGKKAFVRSFDFIMVYDGEVCKSAIKTGIPSTLESSGLVRSDGKRPDSITYAPWAQGRPLVWDVTVPDTLAASYRSIATQHSGAVTEMAEKKKESVVPPHPHFLTTSYRIFGGNVVSGGSERKCALDFKYFTYPP